MMQSRKKYIFKNSLIAVLTVSIALGSVVTPSTAMAQTAENKIVAKSTSEGLEVTNSQGAKVLFTYSAKDSLEKWSPQKLEQIFNGMDQERDGESGKTDDRIAEKLNSAIKTFQDKSKNQTELERTTNAERRLFRIMQRLGKTAVKFPPEAFAFFIATGLVTTIQMLTQYENNPVGFAQHIEHQLSPLGLFGFYMFIVANGATMDYLMGKMKNPNASQLFKKTMKHFPPHFLGMTAGMFAQTYVIDLISDPNIQACGKSLARPLNEKDFFTGASENPCQEAFKDFILGGKIYQLVPSLFSMLASTWLAGQTQGALFRITGWDVFSFAVPLGGQVRSASFMLKQFIAKINNLALFVGIDTLFLNDLFTYPWMNLADNPVRVSRRYNNIIRDRNYDEDDIKVFTKTMAEWRQFVLRKPFMAYNNWSQYLDQMMNQHMISKLVYEQYVHEINERNQVGKNNKFYSDYLLNGVTASRLNAGNENLFLTDAKLIQSLQIETISKATQEIETLLKTDKYFSDLKKLNNKYYSNIIDMLTLFKSDVVRSKAEGLYILRNELMRARYERQNKLLYNQYYRYALEKINKLFGDPDPKFHFGEGLMATIFKVYSANPEKSALVDGVKYSENNGPVDFYKLGDYLAYKMVCGEPVSNGDYKYRKSNHINNEKFGITVGVPLGFKPPQISDPQLQPSICSEKLSGIDRKKNIFGLKVKEPISKKEYSNLMEYLSQNLHSGLISTGEDKFEGWWNEYIDKDIMLAYERYYVPQYQKISIDFKNALNTPLVDVLNVGDVVSNPYEAMGQELNAYLSVLKENGVSEVILESIKRASDKRIKMVRSKISYNNIKNQALDEATTELDQILKPIEDELSPKAQFQNSVVSELVAPAKKAALILAATKGIRSLDTELTSYILMTNLANIKAEQVSGEAQDEEQFIFK